MARSLVRSRLAQADVVRNRWAISPEAGATIDDVMRPEYTANVAGALKQWDVVEVRPDDETYYAELLVKTAERTGATFWLIHFVELAPKVGAAQESDPFAVSWGGPHQKHRVVRKADNEVLKHGFSSAEDARLWAIEHAKTVA
mgnify:CR=1 FL=1